MLVLLSQKFSGLRIYVLLWMGVLVVAGAFLQLISGVKLVIYFQEVFTESIVGIHLGMCLNDCASSLTSVCALTSLSESSNSESRTLFSASIANPFVSSS